MKCKHTQCHIIITQCSLPQSECYGRSPNPDSSNIKYPWPRETAILTKFRNNVKSPRRQRTRHGVHPRGHHNRGENKRVVLLTCTAMRLGGKSTDARFLRPARFFCMGAKSAKTSETGVDSQMFLKRHIRKKVLSTQRKVRREEGQRGCEARSCSPTRYPRRNRVSL